ncbi:glycosyltransferase family 2 protein [archaeon]|nr:glycosyltransferase family 2 protein [archaeon]
MLEKKSLAVIIPNWNGKKYLVECLPSLQKQHFKDFKTIILDNGSSDGSVDWIAKTHPEVHLIDNKKNLGFSGAINKGLRLAMDQGYKYFVLLNQDTVVQENFLDAGIKMLDSDADVCCPKILYYSNKTIWYAGSPIFRGYGDFMKNHIIKLLIEESHGEEDGPQFDKQKEVGFASGCSLFIRRDVLEKVGLLDERFFFNWEAKDFCRRVRNAGYRLMYFPDTVVLHNVPYLKDTGNVFKKYFFSKTGYWQITGFLKYMKKHFGLARTILYVLKVPFDVPFILWWYYKKKKS